MDLNQATLRNWIEKLTPHSTKSGSSRSNDSEEIRSLKKRVAELERTNEILKTRLAFFAQAELDRRLK